MRIIIPKLIEHFFRGCQFGLLLVIVADRDMRSKSDLALLVLMCLLTFLKGLISRSVRTNECHTILSFNLKEREDRSGVFIITNIEIMHLQHIIAALSRNIKMKVCGFSSPKGLSKRSIRSSCLRLL